MQEDRMAPPSPSDRRVDAVRGVQRPNSVHGGRDDLVVAGRRLRRRIEEVARAARSESADRDSRGTAPRCARARERRRRGYRTAAARRRPFDRAPAPALVVEPREPIRRDDERHELMHDRDRGVGGRQKRDDRSATTSHARRHRRRRESQRRRGARAAPDHDAATSGAEVEVARDAREATRASVSRAARGRPTPRSNARRPSSMRW